MLVALSLVLISALVIWKAVDKDYEGNLELVRLLPPSLLSPATRKMYTQPYVNELNLVYTLNLVWTKTPFLQKATPSSYSGF